MSASSNLCSYSSKDQNELAKFCRIECKHFLLMLMQRPGLAHRQMPVALNPTIRNPIVCYLTHDQ